MKSGDPVHKFGEFLVKNLHDEAIGFFEQLALGQWKAPALQPLQKALASLTPPQREIIRECVRRSLVAGLHRFLFALGEAHDIDQGITVLVDGADIAEQSDGLQGEIFGDDGWLAKYSKYGHHAARRIS